MINVYEEIQNAKDRGVTSVDLCYNHIAEHAPATAAAFKGSSVTSVNLSGNNISLSDSLQVLKTFQEGNTITSLAIDHSKHPEFVELLNAPREYIENEGQDLLGLNQDILGIIGEYITLDIFE